LYFANASSIDNDDFATEIEGDKVLDSIIDNNPNNVEFKITTVDTTKSPRVSLGNTIISDAFEDAGKTLRISLNKDFFGSSIVNADGTVVNPSVLNTNDFLDIFKGVYVKPIDANAGLVRVFDNSFTVIEAKIEVVFEITTGIGEMAKLSEEIIDFNMDRQVVNIIDASTSADFDLAFQSKATATLKGGVAASRLKLFARNEELNSFFEQKPIINQATLKFFVNKDSNLSNEDSFPENLIINDLENGVEVSVAELSEDKSYYEFNITSYLKGIFNQVDSEAALNANVELVVGVTEVATAGRSSLRIFGSQAKRISIGSLQSVKEVFLYGSEAVVGKRPQLTIKYTQTK